MLRRDSSVVSKAQKARDALVELRRSRAAAVTKQQDITAQLKAQQSELQAAADAIAAELSRLSEQMLGALETVRARSTAANDATWQRFVQANGGMRAENYLSPSAAAARAVEVALAQRGDPYVWGAVGPDTFDCSGLTRYAYAAAGVSIPRVSRDQYNFGQKVPLTDLLAGDLVFYARNLSDPSTIHHVAMYIGNGSIVHAPHTGDVVRVAPVWRSGLIGATRPTLPGQRPGAPLAPPDVLNPTGTAPPVPPPVVEMPAPTRRPNRSRRRSRIHRPKRQSHGTGKATPTPRHRYGDDEPRPPIRHAEPTPTLRARRTLGPRYGDGAAYGDSDAHTNADESRRLQYADGESEPDIDVDVVGNTDRTGAAHGIAESDADRATRRARGRADVPARYALIRS